MTNNNDEKQLLAEAYEGISECVGALTKLIKLNPDNERFWGDLQDQIADLADIIWHNYQTTKDK